MIKIFYFVLIVSSTSLLYCVGAIGGAHSGAVPLLPFSVLLLTIVFKPVYDLMASSVVFNLFILQVCIRYCVLPILVSGGQSVGVGHGSDYLDVAVVVMVLELISAFIVMRTFANKQKNAYLDKSEGAIGLRPGLALPLILLGMFGYMYAEGVFEKVNSVWSVSSYVQKYGVGGEELEVGSLGLVMFTPFKALLALYFVSWVHKSERIKPSRKKWLYLMAIFISSSVIVGVSRFSMVLFSLPLLIVTSYLLTRKELFKVGFLACILILTSVSIASIAKFSRHDDVVSTQNLVSASSIGAYFAGPGNIAVGFEAFDEVKSYESILFFINDTIQNIPLASKFALQEYRLSSVFNEQIYGHNFYADQIVPLSVSGLFHFGVVGVFVYSSFFLILALYLERKSYAVRHISYKYLLVYLSTTLSLVFMLSLSSFYAAAARALLFLYVPFLLINAIPRIARK